MFGIINTKSSALLISPVGQLAVFATREVAQAILDTGTDEDREALGEVSIVELEIFLAQTPADELATGAAE